MGFYKNIISLLAVLLFSIASEAQEQLHPLSGNINLPKIISANQPSAKKVSTTGSMYLPFFDDFSYAYKSPYPSADNWTDSSTYVNTGFAIAPITLGVATFDGLSKLGYPYDISASVSNSSSADTLKSRPIHLDSIVTGSATHYYVPGDSIALMFYYQAEGFGEAPEASDSLCLDFFKPKIDTSGKGRWVNVWGKAGYNPSATDTNFYRVKISIIDTAYFHDGFQFRFRNKATASGSLDHWNIDNVQLKTQYFYDDTMANNVVFVYKPSSFLKNYSVIPYRQYNTLERANTFRNYIRNNYTTKQQGNYEYVIKDKSNTPVPTDPIVTFPFPGILPFMNNGYYSLANAATPGFILDPFPASFSDSTYFTITHRIIQSSDTTSLVHIQRFSNYYAYDDGSAEQGYYLNTYGAKTAVRFTLNVVDTLKAVRIYFDPIVEGSIIQGSPFRIIVWADGGNGPGNVIYKDSVMKPIYLSGDYNKIPEYRLTSCLPLGVGTYFIGIQQTTDQQLNIGLDKNTNHKDALYYNLSGTWSQSSINGSIMINPVMGCVDPPAIVGLHNFEKLDKVRVFPNPAQNIITVSFPGNQLEIFELEIITALGQTVLTKTISSNEQIDISNLSNGLYFIHLKGSSLNVSSQKLIISR